MSQLTDRITALESKLKSLKARQLKDDLRRRTLESRRSRKADTRRKILIGASVLARIEQGRFSQTELTSWLNQALTRADDRALFDLPQEVGRHPTAPPLATSANNVQVARAFQLTPAKSGKE